jgi:hypothetical protein
MPPIDYVALLTQEFEEYAGMLIRRQEADLEIAQKEQFIRATINMLPEDKKPTWAGFLDVMSAGDIGLSESIRNVLRAAPGRFYTATEVKQLLVKSGFDFTKYTTNPLSSVHAALKRLKPEEAEMNQIEGVMAWRWIKPAPLSIGKEAREALDSMFNKGPLPVNAKLILPRHHRTRRTPVITPNNPATGKPLRPVVDLMAALRASLESDRADVRDAMKERKAKDGTKEE